MFYSKSCCFTISLFIVRAFASIIFHYFYTIMHCPIESTCLDLCYLQLFIGLYHLIIVLITIYIYNSTILSD
jgi:hypothetical protein